MMLSIVLRGDPNYVAHAMEAVAQMRARGLTPRSDTFNTLMQAAIGNADFLQVRPCCSRPAVCCVLWVCAQWCSHACMLHVVGRQRARQRMSSRSLYRRWVCEHAHTACGGASVSVVQRQSRGGRQQSRTTQNAGAGTPCHRRSLQNPDALQILGCSGSPFGVDVWSWLRFSSIILCECVLPPCLCPRETTHDTV